LSDGFQTPPVPDANTILVKGLPMNDPRVTPDALCTLFGVYGDVLRVKIFNRKQDRDKAIIQFLNHDHAARAKEYLKGIVLYNSPLALFWSWMTEAVRVPSRPNDHGELLTKDYTHNLEIHRFRLNPMLDQRRLAAPTRILHVANITHGTKADDLKEFFSTATDGDRYFPPGTEVDMFREDKPMCYIKFRNISDATAFLIRFHNVLFRERPLRVQFSRDIRPRAVGDRRNPTNNNNPRDIRDSDRDSKDTRDTRDTRDDSSSSSSSSSLSSRDNDSSSGGSSSRSSSGKAKSEGEKEEEQDDQEDQEEERVDRK